MKATDGELIRRILKVYWDADVHDLLWWRVDDDEITFMAMCNDLFAWATADGEPITAENIQVLEETAAELKAIPITPKSDPLMYLSELFAARVRGMRPQRPCYKRMAPDISALFDACGPERDPATED